MGKVDVTDRKIVINYTEQGVSKSVGINSIIIGIEEWKQLTEIFKKTEE